MATSKKGYVYKHPILQIGSEVIQIERLKGYTDSVTGKVYAYYKKLKVYKITGYNVFVSSL